MRQYASRQAQSAAATDRALRPYAPSAVPASAGSAGAIQGFDFSQVPIRVQPKLTVGEIDDPLEREADRIAEHVMRKPDGAPPVRASSSGAAGSGIPAPPVVQDVLASPGRPLDTATRAFMEPRFGRDFSGVRVHADAKAADAAAAIGARAFTSGSAIAFATPQPLAPTSANRMLLAHELAHVVQQQRVPGAILRQAGHDDGPGGPPAAGGTAQAEHDDGPGEAPAAGGASQIANAEQCPGDASLDAKYDAWIHYDDAKDAEEKALIARINAEYFGPINKSRNAQLEDSYENYQKGKDDAYTWIHDHSKLAVEHQKDAGVGGPATDLAPKGAMQPHVLGGKQPEHTHWLYDPAKMPSGMPDINWDGETATSGDNVMGFQTFSDPKGRSLTIPQLGFPQKPAIDTRQVMCGDAETVKPGSVKRRAGPKGERVTKTGLGDLLRGGHHFFVTKKKAAATGQDTVYGLRAGPGKSIYWFFHSLPDDSDKREKIEKAMHKKVDKIMEGKEDKYERLKQYYIQRAAFIAKYKVYLK